MTCFLDLRLQVLLSKCCPGYSALAVTRKRIRSSTQLPGINSNRQMLLNKLETCCRLTELASSVLFCHVLLKKCTCCWPTTLVIMVWRVC